MPAISTAWIVSRVDTADGVARNTALRGRPAVNSPEIMGA